MHKTILILVFVLVVPEVVDAQCSMCKLVAESSYESGSDVGRGLNDGITYIMGIPYLLIAGVGYLLFRKNFSK
jgi:hypothetical protein